MDLVADLKRQNRDLKEAQVEGILYLILNNQPMSNGDLLRQTGLPKETLRVFKDSISSYLEDPIKDEVVFNKKGVEVVTPLNPTRYAWRLLEYQDLEFHTKVANIKKIREKYNLEPKREYDQFFATAETSVSKAQILSDKGLIKDKHIALLGDDDLVSVVLGDNWKDYKSIAVFDIDSALLHTINSICEELDIKNVRTQVYDARNSLNADFLGSFDVVITDPPYTREGIALFTERALELLGETQGHEGKYIFLYYGNSFKTPEKALKIQELISTYNLLIEDKIGNFASYAGAESIGSSSSIYVLKTTPFTHIPAVSVRSEIYTYEKPKEEKFPFVDHYVFKVHEVHPRVVGSKKALQKIFGDFCISHKLKVVDTKITRFKGQGFSLTYILANSNLVVHTWPEYQALHIDLITCMPIHNKNGMYNTLANLLGTKNIDIRNIE